MKAAVASIIALASVVVVACARNGAKSNGQSTQSTPECLPAVAALPPSVSLDSLVGTYRLTLVATATGNAERRVTGTLELAKGAGRELTGTATIALDSVGATAPGEARDGRYPVTAMQWNSGEGTPDRVTVRFGTPTNAIEGPHMALHPSSASPSGFRGSWTSASGELGGRTVSGYFCAVR